MSARIEMIDKNGKKWVICGGTQGELETGILALSSALDHESHASQKRKVGRPPKTKEAQKKADGRFKIALGILRAMNAAGDDGATGSILAKAVGAEANNAFGPTMGMVNRLIQAAGYSKESVYQTSGFGKAKRWTAQSSIVPAIKKLEEMESDTSL